MSDLAERLHAGDPRALPRLLSLIENGTPEGAAVLGRLRRPAERAHVVGITGPPGAGKSTLIDAMVGAVRASGRRVAVLAIDPSSPVSGGAVLGDRIRMLGRGDDAGVFVRSMAARGGRGGLAATARDAVRVLEAAGYPIVLVETVGTGQDGVEIAALAETVVLVQVPGLGDGVQAIKAGVLEIAHIIAVNKADLPGAADQASLLRDLARGGGSGDEPAAPVLLVSAVSGEGVFELLAAVDEHRSSAATGESTARRDRIAEDAAREEILAGVVTALRRRLKEGAPGVVWLNESIAAVVRREATTEQVIASLLDRIVDAGDRPEPMSVDDGGASSPAT